MLCCGPAVTLARDACLPSTNPGCLRYQQTQSNMAKRAAGNLPEPSACKQDVLDSLKSKALDLFVKIDRDGNGVIDRCGRGVALVAAGVVAAAAEEFGVTSCIARLPATSYYRQPATGDRKGLAMKECAPSAVMLLWQLSMALGLVFGSTVAQLLSTFHVTPAYTVSNARCLSGHTCHVKWPVLHVTHPQGGVSGCYEVAEACTE